MNEEQLSALKALVGDLVSANFESIFSDERNGRLSLSEIQNAVSEYPGVLTPMPEGAFNRVHYYPRTNHEDTLGIAEINLWFNGEKSDLTLSVDYVLQDGKWHVSINDIHVL
jgi:hypothetical protein